VSTEEDVTEKSPVVVSAVRQKLAELFHSSFWTSYWPPLIETMPYWAQDWVVAACAEITPSETIRRTGKI
jgi:hypothetical protein